MRSTKILWLVVPAVFLLAMGMTLLAPAPQRKPEVYVRVIVVKADPEDPADIERARRKSKEIMEFLEKGANFEQLAINESEAPSAEDGGDMGWVGKGVLPERLEEVVFTLEPGQHSEIVEDRAGEDLVFRILYVEKRRNF